MKAGWPSIGVAGCSFLGKKRAEAGVTSKRAKAKTRLTIRKGLVFMLAFLSLKGK
jgi:hypothetical protein